MKEGQDKRKKNVLVHKTRKKNMHQKKNCEKKNYKTAKKLCSFNYTFLLNIGLHFYIQYYHI